MTRIFDSLKRLSLVLTLLSPLALFAQKGGPVVFTVDQDTVWGAEFERVFSKNNKNPDVRPSQQELEEYLNLYVRFKLKVKEAYRLEMDTNQAYQKELAGYRKQLAQPYLTDKAVTEKLMQEAYDRMQYEVDASNLMIYLSPVASPQDTLEAWNRINNWYHILSTGIQEFDKLTRDSSTDDHGKKEAGRLGYFSTFNMIYPFENTAYTTPVGGISKPFRTQFGYHILKVHDKRPARGDLRVAHILIRINNETEYDTTRPRIDAIYNKLKSGAKWDQLVLDFSEDFSTRERGGELNWIKSIGGSIPADFREAAYALKDGEFSKPVKTELGWHIIKRIEERPLPEFKDIKETIRLKISRDSRSELNRTAVLARIKKENGYQFNAVNWDIYRQYADSSLVKGALWTPDIALTTPKELFRIGDSIYTFNTFTEYVKVNPPMQPTSDYKQHVERLMERFVDSQNLMYEESILESKYDDFRYLMQEYRDGILLFELTNKMVWSKATEDTTGLRQFFEAHRDHYQWKDRAVVREYTCNNAKTAKKLSKGIAKGKSDEALKEKLNKKNALALKIKERTIERGSDSLVDALKWEGLQLMDDPTNNVVYLRFDNIIPAGPKSLKEAMGPVTSEYQNHLEDEWIDTLKQR